jgi:putative transposase
VPSYTKLLYHIVFATKARAASIENAWRARLLEYLAGAATGLGASVIAVGGVEDHVHLLVGLRATHSLADFLREPKKASSVWVHGEIGLASFAWQEGYGAFTVDQSSVDAVYAYVKGQEEHHRSVGSREELLRLLKAAGIDVDMRFFE